MKKRFSFVSIVLLVIFSALVGCGKKKEADLTQQDNNPKIVVGQDVNPQFSSEISESSQLENGADSSAQDNVFYLGETQLKDGAYNKNKDMKDSDVHKGWDLGQFRISGFTGKTEDNHGNVVFLKTVGDKVQLTFELEQDIAALNNDETLIISEDKNGYDSYFDISKDERTNFGLGALLVKYTDYQNKTTYVEPYTNYLKGVEKGATTEILFYDEGDYEIALDYEVQKKKWGPIPDGYSNYQILIKFSVRNGNCMVYPFDAATGSELLNTSFTENGFYLDLARSRYLKIDVKKQNYVESGGGLIEDTRFNKVATDGELFTDPGIYIITVKNSYADLETQKKIYVGSDPILKAYVTTGEDIGTIKTLLSEGATIEDDGTITLPVKESNEPETKDTVKHNNVNEPEIVAPVINDTGENDFAEPGVYLTTNELILLGAGLLTIMFFIALISMRKKKINVDSSMEKGNGEEDNK